MELTVHFNWDVEASVFCAWSDDVPGLVAEAATFPELEEVVRDLVPALLEISGRLPTTSQTAALRLVHEDTLQLVA